MDRTSQLILSVYHKRCRRGQFLGSGLCMDPFWNNVTVNEELYCSHWYRAKQHQVMGTTNENTSEIDLGDNDTLRQRPSNKQIRLLPAFILTVANSNQDRS